MKILLCVPCAIVLMLADTARADDHRLAQQDFPALRSKLLPLAEKGDATAELMIGSFYAQGLGTPKDPVQAVAWMRKAAVQGLAEAQVQLGIYYLNGSGVAQDRAQGVAWIRKAAMQGNDSAEWLLGGIYTSGEYVSKDYAQAVLWTRKAVAKGNGASLSALGELYANGWGVPQDPVAACALHELALASRDFSFRSSPERDADTAKWQGVRSHMTAQQRDDVAPLVDRMRSAGVLQVLDTRK